ncbi:hypothetical protein GCM10020216_061370 [Nonomuraea helvata]
MVPPGTADVALPKEEFPVGTVVTLSRSVVIAEAALGRLAHLPSSPEQQGNGGKMGRQLSFGVQDDDILR